MADRCVMASRVSRAYDSACEPVIVVGASLRKYMSVYYSFSGVAKHQNRAFC